MRAVITAAILVGAGACGGKPPPPPAPPPDNTAAESSNASANMVTPDQMDAITSGFARKRETVSRCLATAVDNKELPRNSKGKVTLEVVITHGRATSVKVVNATLASQSLNDCVLSRVREIEFPTLANPYETSYTYEFEAI